jgi:dephospho-CoA kinase
LLLESGGRQRFDRIIVIDVDPEVQIARAVSRGMTAEEAKRRIANQMPRDERLRYADYVIDNSGDEAAALAEATRVYELLLADLEAKKKSPGLAPGAEPQTANDG